MSAVEVQAYRASHAQLRMWYAHRLEPDSPYYNSAIHLRLRGPVDPSALAAGLRTVVDRHEALRTTFVEHEGELLQLVRDDVEVPLTRLEAVAPLEGTLVGGPLLEQLLEITDEPFDLERGPLLRAALVRFGDDDALLVLVMHHIVIDGWSMGPLLREIGAGYRAALAGVEPELPELEIQYGDFAEWQRDRPDDAGLERWTQRLGGALPALDLPIDRPRSAAPSPRAGGRLFEFDAALTDRIRAHARAHRVTTYVAVLAAYAGLLSRLAQQEELVIGTPSAARSLPQVQPLIGYFVNTLPMRIEVPAGASFAQLTGVCAAVTDDAFGDDEVPLDRIVEAVRPPRREGRTPLFDTLFTVQSTSSAPLGLPGVEVEMVDPDHWFTRYDLELNVWDSGERMRAMLVYREELFEPATADALVSRLVTWLDAVTREPERPLTEIELFGPDETPSPADLEAVVERTLPVRECAVLVDPSTGAPVVHAVPADAIDEARIAAAVDAMLPVGLRTRAVALTTSLPRAADGEIDRAALAEAPAIARGELERWGEAVRAEAGVREARVRLEDVSTPAAHLIVDPVLATGLGPANAASDRDRDPVADAPVESSGVERPRALADGGPALAPPVATLPEALAVAARGDHGIRIVDAQGRTTRTSYAELHTAARRIAAGLAARGIGPGDELLLQLPDDRAVVHALWGAMLAGATPVPLAFAATEQGRARLQGARAALPDAVVLDAAMLEELAAHEIAPEEGTPAVDADARALLLLTSGSTGVPKAVPLTHRNVLTRSAAAIAVAELGGDDVSLNWMPLDHVGGVVMSHVRDVVAGVEQVQVSTEHVLGDPLRWMLLAAEHGAAASWAPNFAFGLVAERAHELPPIDLSCLRYLLNGGEAVVASTARAFLRALAPFGLPPTAVRPSWGMSETTSGQTDSRTLTLETTSDDDTHVEVGAPYPGFRIRIVDAHGDVAREGDEGHLEVRGAGVTAGYLGGVEPESFSDDGWFRTGDLAVLRDGRLTITGRGKDVIIVGGLNRACHELESAVEHVAGVTRSCVAAAAVRAPGDAADRVAIFYHHPDGAGAAGEVRRGLLERTGLRADLLVPLEPGEFPRTSIGKIQRSQLRARLEDGELDARLLDVARAIGGPGTVPDRFHRPAWRRLDAPRVDASPVLVGGGDPLEALEGELATRGAPPRRAAAIGDVESGERAVVVLDDIADARALVAALPDPAPEVIVVVRGAWSVDAADRPSPERAAIPAFLRSAAAEIPGLRLRVVEIPERMHDPAAEIPGSLHDLATSPAADPSTEQLRALADEVAAWRGEPEVALRDGAPFARRLVDAGAADRVDRGAAPVFAAGSRILVTGGAGGIGRHLVPRLIERFGAEVIVASRGEPAPGALPEGVAWHRLDATDADAVRALVETTRPDAVLHLAGRFAQAPAASAPTDLAASAKVAGALALDAALADRPDVPLVLFSSANGFFGAARAAVYAAENAALDALAARRTAEGRPVRAIAWSMWHGTGLDVEDGEAELSRRRGFHRLDPASALDALEVALRLPDPVVHVGLDADAAFTGSRIEQPHRARRRFAADVVADAPLGPPPAARGAETSWHRVDALVDERERPTPTGRAQRLVAEAWCEALGVDRVAATDGFFDQGGGSIQMTRLHGLLQRRFEREIPLVELFRHTTVEAMAAYLEPEPDAGPASRAREAGRRAAGRRRAARGRTGARRDGGAR